MRRMLLSVFALLLAIPAAASITGVVINPEGQPIAGAKVSLCAPETVEARRERLLSKTPQRPALATMPTDSKGTFAFESPKGQPVVDLRIEASGFAPDAVRLLADDDAGAISLLPAPIMRGTITANGKPVAGAAVIWIGNNTDFLSTTDAEGHYSVPNPSKWANRMAIAHPDYAIHQEVIRNEVKSLDRSLDPGVAVRGRVVGQDGQTAVARASIVVDDLPLASSGDDGSFTIAHAPKEWQEVEGLSGSLGGVRARSGPAALTIRLAKLGTITGVVRDAKSQLPLVNAEVRLGPDNPMGRLRGFGAGANQMAIRSVLTDAKGVFTITTTPGRYSLMAVYPSSIVSSALISVSAGQTVNKALWGAARGRVSGTVMDDAKQPVAGARIEARDVNRGGPMAFVMNRTQPNLEAYSGPDGRFVMRSVTTDAEIQIQAVKKGLPPGTSAKLRLNPGERKTGVLLTIPRGVVFSGKVTDGDGRPLSGVSVEPVEAEGVGQGIAVRRIVRSMIRDRSDEDIVRTGSDGAFNLRLKEGTYDVLFKRDGFATRTLRAQSVTASTPPVTVKLDPGVEISGRVVRGGAGIEGVTVNAISMEGAATATTAPDGSFTLSDLTPGQMMVTATKPDAMIQQMRPVTAPARDVVFDLPRGGRISGRVVDKESKAPVTSFQAGIATSRSAGPMTVVTPPMLKPFTSDDGTFVLENVPPGPTEVVVSAPGYTTEHVPGLNVEDGKTLNDVEVDLETGGKLSGRVTATDGTPLNGVTVRLDPMAGAGPGRVMRFNATNPTAVTDPNGEYSMDSIEPGDKTFTFSHDGYLSESRTVNVAGKDTRLDVQLSTGVSLNGVVSTDAGVPVSDASVNAMSASDPNFGRQSRTDANGQFQIAGVAPGHYTITASKSGLADGILRDFDVSSGAPARVVMKTGGTITGHVIGLTDAELQQTTVTASGANGSASAEVDAGGNYRIDGAPTGSVRVSARAGRGMVMGGKSSPVKSVQLDPGSSVQVDIEFKSSTVIRGRVTRNGQPLANATIAFLPRGGQTQTNSSGTTDSNGAYEINGLDDGPYSVSVIDLDRSGSFATSYTVSGSGNFDIDIKSATLRGTVVDSTTGEPIADARVQIQAAGGNLPGMFSSRAAVTDPSGAFLIDNVQSGSYQATAQKDGYGHDVRNFVVGDTPPDDLQFKIAPSDGVTLRVVDARDNRLLGANVLRVTDAQGREVESGGFRFGGTPEPIKLTLAPGRYSVTVTAIGYAPQVVNVVSPSTQTVSLTPGGTLVLRSKSSAPQRVRLIMPNGAFYPRGMNGIFTIDPSPLTTTLNNVAGGSYTLQVLDAGGNVTNTIPVTVVDGQQNVVEV